MKREELSSVPNACECLEDYLKALKALTFEVGVKILFQLLRRVARCMCQFSVK